MASSRGLVSVLIAVALSALGAPAASAQGDHADEGAERRGAASDGDAATPARVNATETGTLAVTGTPGSLVAIDGRHAGVTPWEGTVVAGLHRVRVVRREAAFDYQATVTVRPGSRAVLRHRVTIPTTGVPAPSPSLTPEEARYRTAQRCASAGDHECVIGELRNHCVRARDYELYIASLRARTGYELEIEEAMRAYIARYPTERLAPDYRAYLAAHPNGP